MSATVNVTELKQIVKFTAKAKKEGISIPTFIWGAHGIGKTTIITEVAKELDYECVCLNLANQSPEELLGLPNIDKENQTTEYFKPEWLKTESEKPVIYFIDELNRAPKYVLQAIFSFVNEGRLHTHYINDHDIIIAAGNPSALDYEVTEFDDKAFLSRFAHMYLEPEHIEVIQYFESQNVHPCVVEMMKEDNEIFEKVAVAETDKLKINPDPRMMEKVGQVLNIVKPAEMKKFGLSLVEAMIGTDKATIVASKFVNQDQIPDPKDILEGKVKCTVLSHDRIDIINAFNTKLVKYLKEEGIFEKSTVPEKICKSMKEYIEYLPKDSSLGLVKEMKIANIETINMIKLFKGVDQGFLFDLMEVPVTD